MSPAQHRGPTPRGGGGGGGRGRGRAGGGGNFQCRFSQHFITLIATAHVHAIL